jgi:SAM-dependent methyltransferase
VTRPLGTFISTNKRASFAIEGHFPQTRLELDGHYDQTVAAYMNSLAAGSIVVDFGSGKECRFARYRPPGALIKIIGVDISDEELAENRDVDEKHVVDVTGGLPFGAAEVDLVASRYVLEHLSDTEMFIAESGRVLKPRGYSIHLFSSKFALASILNSVLPSRISGSLLDLFHPECKGIIGFQTHYDRTYPSGLSSLFRRHGFDIVGLKVSYYQSHYYSFFLPLYLFSALYEMLLYAVRAENLAAKAMIIAKKR